MKCPTADVTIRCDGWSTHVTRAVDAPSRNAEHEKEERRRLHATSVPSLTNDHFPPPFSSFSLEVLFHVPSQNDGNIHNLSRTLSPAFSTYFLVLVFVAGCTFLLFLFLCFYQSAARGRKHGKPLTTRRTSSGRERGQTFSIDGSGLTTAPIPRAACKLAWTGYQRLSGSTKGRTDCWSPPHSGSDSVEKNGGKRP